MVRIPLITSDGRHESWATWPSADDYAADGGASWQPLHGYASVPLTAVHSYPADLPYPADGSWTYADGRWTNPLAPIVLPRWRAIGYLLSLPRIDAGPIAQYPGDRVLHQVEAMLSTMFSSGQISAMAYARYGTDPWHEDDVQVAAVGALLGLSISDVHDWFVAARDWRPQ